MASHLGLLLIIAISVVPNSLSLPISEAPIAENIIASSPVESSAFEQDAIPSTAEQIVGAEGTKAAVEDETNGVHISIPYFSITPGTLFPSITIGNTKYPGLSLPSLEFNSGGINIQDAPGYKELAGTIPLLPLGSGGSEGDSRPFLPEDSEDIATNPKMSSEKVATVETLVENSPLVNEVTPEKVEVAIAETLENEETDVHNNATKINLLPSTLLTQAITNIGTHMITFGAAVTDLVHGNPATIHAMPSMFAAQSRNVSGNSTDSVERDSATQSDFTSVESSPAVEELAPENVEVAITGATIDEEKDVHNNDTKTLATAGLISSILTHVGNNIVSVGTAVDDMAHGRPVTFQLVPTIFAQSRNVSGNSTDSAERDAESTEVVEADSSKDVSEGDARPSIPEQIKEVASIPQISAEEVATVETSVENSPIVQQLTPAVAAIAETLENEEADFHNNDTKILLPVSLISNIITNVGNNMAAVGTALNDLAHGSPVTFQINPNIFAAQSRNVSGNSTDSVKRNGTSESESVEGVEVDSLKSEVVLLSAAESNNVESSPTAADLVDVIPSEDEVDEVRTESVLEAEVDEKAVENLVSDVEQEIVSESNVNLSLVRSPVIPLFPEFRTYQRQVAVSPEEPTSEFEPLNLVIPILPSLPEKVDEAASKNTEQVEDSSSLSPNLRLSNPLPLISSSPIFREPLAVLNEQVERLRPFLKYVSSHIPSVSVDPFNINSREGTDAEETLLDDASSLFYLQDQNDPLNQIIPLLRGPSQPKPNPEDSNAEKVKWAVLEHIDELNKLSLPVSELEVKPQELNTQKEVLPNGSSDKSSPVVAEVISPVLLNENDVAPVPAVSALNEASVTNSAEKGRNVSSAEAQSKDNEDSGSPAVADVTSTSNKEPTSKPQTDSPAPPPPPPPAKNLTTSVAPDSNSSPSNSRPNRPSRPSRPSRPAFGIQSNNSSSKPETAAKPPATNPPRPFSIPGILLNPIEALGWQLPSFQWPSFTQMLGRIFGRNPNSNSNNNNLRFGIELGDCLEEDESEDVELKSTFEGDKSMCQTDPSQGLPSSECNKFCNLHGFTNGTCFNGENCVCDMAREDGTFGLSFKRLADYGEISRMESLELPSEEESADSSSHQELRCSKCSCSSDCQKAGAYIGYCGNTCYCGLPWQAGSLTL